MAEEGRTERRLAVWGACSVGGSTSWRTRCEVGARAGCGAGAASRERERSRAPAAANATSLWRRCRPRDLPRACTGSHRLCVRTSCRTSGRRYKRLQRYRACHRRRQLHRVGARIGRSRLIGPGPQRQREICDRPRRQIKSTLTLRIRQRRSRTGSRLRNALPAGRGSTYCSRIVEYNATNLYANSTSARPWTFGFEVISWTPS